MIELNQQKRKHSKLTQLQVADVCCKCNKTMRRWSAKPPIKDIFQFENWIWEFKSFSEHLEIYT